MIQWKPQYNWPAGFAVCAIVLCVMVGWSISAYKDAAFEKRQAEYEGKLEVLKTDRDGAIAKAKLFEERAKEAEAKAAINEAAVAAAGKKADAIREKIQNEDEQFTEAMRAVDLNLSPCARIIHICETARRLGYYPASKTCLCTDQ
jgi:hypothetical protein